MAREYARRFYHSSEWANARTYVIERDKGLCKGCLRKGKIMPGDEVHHKIWIRPTNIDNADITLNQNNLEYLCRDCHFQIHKQSMHLRSYRKIVNNGVYIDERGNMQKQMVYIVHGAPGSGKTTFVKDNMKSGDLIVDLDLIKHAISMCSKAQVLDNLYEVSESIRELLYERIESKRIDSKTIWIISMLPTREARQQLQLRFDAKLIHIDTDIDACVERILNDDEREDKEFQMKLIDKYFGHYEPPHK